VPEVVGADARGPSGVVDQGGHRLAETVTAHVGHPEFVAGFRHCVAELSGSRMSGGVDAEQVLR
jgi:hypothetical protein